MTATPGAIHHARWMAAGIYLLKMFIFEDLFEIPLQKQQDVRAFVCFVTYIYDIYWFKSPVVLDVPALTLKLHKDLKSWDIIDPNGTRAAIRKLDLHTDYLNGQNVALSFASRSLDDNTKAKMAKKLLSLSKPTFIRGKPIAPIVYEDSHLTDFINDESWLIFELCQMNPLFLSLPVVEWNGNASFEKFCTIVRGLTPLNDAGERAVKLGSDYHNQLALHPV